MKRMFPLFGKYGYAIQEGLTAFINGVFDTKAKSNAGWLTFILPKLVQNIASTQSIDHRIVWLREKFNQRADVKKPLILQRWNWGQGGFLFIHVRHTPIRNVTRLHTGNLSLQLQPLPWIYRTYRSTKQSLFGNIFGLGAFILYHMEEYPFRTLHPASAGCQKPSARKIENRVVYPERDGYLAPHCECFIKIRTGFYYNFTYQPSQSVFAHLVTNLRPNAWISMLKLLFSS